MSQYRIILECVRNWINSVNVSPDSVTVMDERARLAVVHALAPSLWVRLTIDVPRADRHPPLRDHSAQVFVTWSPDSDLDLAAVSQMGGIKAENHSEPVAIQVGRGRLATVDLTVPDWWDAVSARPDLRIVGRAVLGEKFDMAELRAAYPLLHQRVLIADYLEIESQWRGANYGLVALDLAVNELGKGSDVAVLFPMEPGVQDVAERDAASLALFRYWSLIGFEEFNGIMAKGLL